MRVNSSNIYTKLGIKSTIALGKVVDKDVVRLEFIVSDYYSVSVNSLSDWQQDTEAKKMLCFLLHNQLNYSVGSIAERYNINSLYLRNCIINIYEGCFMDDLKKGLVYSLKDKFKGNAVETGV